MFAVILNFDVNFLTFVYFVAESFLGVTKFLFDVLFLCCLFVT